ncbi:Bax inhibitor-1/YccA family protein [Govanella unica]|uniref:Bax inhibitor-1/YccA family protein n=1 Tax=Govanella unica TaxID=2975056 RepID=A0A9X3Z681_9PROT|nr:Bax inhibitor-1/YccA family protein [Govania unica]
MVQGYKTRPETVATAQTQVAIDQGLRSYMLKVYNFMASAVLLSGLVAYGVSQSQSIMQTIFGTPLMWVVMLAPFGLAMALSFGINRMKASTAQALFWAYAGLMGLSLASIFMVYTGGSVARVFFITSASFGALSLWGYTTKKDLSGFGTFLIMGLFGLIIASVVNIFLKSSMMEFVISLAGVLIFAGLTAYDTQKIKEMYFANDDQETASKKAVMGAFALYLDFVNLFLYLLRFLGDRR